MKHFVLTILLLLATAAVYAGIYKARDAASQAVLETLDIPTTIGPYAQLGADEEVTEHVKRVLQTSTILKRRYRTPSGRPVNLSIVYAGTTRGSLHFPEVCLVGQGWTIRDQDVMPVGFQFVATKLVIVSGGHTEAMLYWFKTGDNLTGNFFVNSWHWARNQLTFNQKASAMIKVSTPVVDNDTESAFMALEDFSAKLTPVLMDYVN